MTDTSKKGGLYKDMVYLQGAVRILMRRKTLDFPRLMCGKISLDDYDNKKLMKQTNILGVLIPPFMHNMDEYRHCLDVIAATNHIGGESCHRHVIMPIWRPRVPDEKEKKLPELLNFLEDSDAEEENNEGDDEESSDSVEETDTFGKLGKLSEYKA